MKTMTKSEENLMAAFAGESQANRKYLAFAKKADQEGFPNVARLFRSAAAAETLNATNPDLSAFRARGGKMLLYSGWSDTAQSGMAMVGYYESVLARDKTARQDVRLFMMPGVEHCFGGPGPSWVNYLDEIDKWVTTGKAPNQIVAYWLNKEQKPTGSRLICAHPKTLKYSGSGNPREASSFKCEE